MRAVTSLAWIPCGVTPPVLPDSTTTEEEMSAYLDILHDRTPARPPARDPPAPVTPDDAAIIERYGLDAYDDECPSPDVVVDDPYQAAPVAPDATDDDWIRPTDLLLVVGKTGDQVPSLEVQLFDPGEESFFVHHELLVPSFPLCLRWLDCEPRTLATGSFAALSTFERHIEIWDMNVAEPMRPVTALQFHEDAIPGLAWNVLQRGALLSASIDCRAAVWALDRCAQVAVFDVGAPAKAAEWSMASSSVFAIASEGGCTLFDARQAAPLCVVCEGVQVENVVWKTGEQFAVADVGGEIAVFEMRRREAPIGSLAAHRGAVTALVMCRSHPVLASTGEDGVCRLWRVEQDLPVMLAEEHMNDGRLYTAAFSPDRTTMLAVGGDGDEVQLWDIANLLGA
jgi:periodic tryptophan protein 1